MSNRRLESLCLAALTALALPWPVLAAEDLRLREGISFIEDLDSGFPIVASKIDDVSVEAGRPALIFFGAAGDLNTNRQAHRLVELYERFKNGRLKFIVIDVDHPAGPEAAALIRQHYRGYIPMQVIIDASGKRTWSHVGELEAGAVKRQLDRVVD